LGILRDPTSILHDDKISFKFFPKTGNVLACKGDKDVYEIDRLLEKASTAALLAFSASGMMCPPMAMYPYKRISPTQGVLDDWMIGCSPTGWMTAEVF
jgi:hypothetical protein